MPRIKPQIPVQVPRSQAILERIHERAEDKYAAESTAELVDDGPERAKKLAEDVSSLLEIVYLNFHNNHDVTKGHYDPFYSGAFVKEEARNHFDAMTSEERAAAFALVNGYIKNLEASYGDTVIQLPRRMGRHATTGIVVTPSADNDVFMDSAQ